MKAYRIAGGLLCVVLCCFSGLFVQSCSGIFKQTTTVYGMVTDDKGAPIEGIDMTAWGKQVSIQRHFATVKTDSSGYYEITVEIAGKFQWAFCSVDNSEIFKRYYPKKSSYETFTDGKKSRCYDIMIGEKTNLDFRFTIE